MRELTVRIRFTSDSLGNVKKGKSGVFTLPRTPAGCVMFLQSWHNANMQIAAKLLNRHQDEVSKIMWDVAIDAIVSPNSFYRRYYTDKDAKRQRYALHECIRAGQVVGINCVVPSTIPDTDFWELMQLAGQYKGLSPYLPQQFGRFDVVSLRPRRNNFDFKPKEMSEKKSPEDSQSSGLSGQ